MRKKIALLVLSLLIAAVIAEIALRVTGKFPSRFEMLHCRRPDLYEEHDVYGYRLRPSRTLSTEYPKYKPRKLTIVSNREGFRSNREFDEPDPRPRILMIGDSFTFGDGVEAEERFSNVVEELRPEWRVDNLGMTGYGPGLMLRAFEQVGVPVRPEVVVVCLYTDDFTRLRLEFAGVGYPIPRYVLEDGKLVGIPYPRPRGIQKLRIARLAEKAIRKVTGGEEARLSPAAQRDVLEAVLDRFRALSKEHGFVLAFSFLPGFTDTSRDQERRGWLAEYCRGHEIACVDLSAPIHAAGREKAFIERNWHLNPVGNRIVAEGLATFLEGIVPKN